MPTRWICPGNGLTRQRKVGKLPTAPSFELEAKTGGQCPPYAG